MENKIINLCKSFGIESEFIGFDVIHSGHINSTYLVYFDNNRNRKDYILQKINKYVFKKPEEVMENIMAVTSYISQKVSACGESSESKTLNFYYSKNNKPFVIDEDGDYWRLCDYIHNTTGFDVTEDLDIIEECGKGFGEFQCLLADFSAEKLNITIPHFHNTPNRYKIFKQSLELNASRRASFVKDEIESYLALEELVSKMYHMQQSGELKLKVTHNDTKCNNVLIDKNTKKFLCVIDLDTVMPGLLGNDFGDAIRFVANTSAEDEPDLSKVNIDFDKFTAFATGFVKMLGTTLTKQEKDTLVLGAITMTVECGLRFLTDYIDGDKYFRVEYSEHNLVRARCQLKLAKSMIENQEKLNQIINNICEAWVSFVILK